MSKAGRDGESVSKGAGRLSVVATPIGNLEDITLRALRTLREASVVLAEDTRRTRGMLTHHGINTPLRSLHAHSGSNVIDECVAALLDGAHLALVTDAGTPLVSDPGAPLIARAVSKGIEIESIPGPSAVTAALAVAGIPCDGFRFFGFLPRTGKARRTALSQVAASEVASVVFESPQRIGRTLRELAELTEPTRSAAVCRELTKLHEEVVRGDLSTLAQRFAEDVRGEITLVVAGCHDTDEPSLIDADARVTELLAAGLSARDAARQVAEETGMPKREAYALVQALARPTQGDED